MRHLFILLNLATVSAFAHGSTHTLGDEADAMKAAGETYHQSVSLIRKMHPEFLHHKRDKTLRQGVRTDQYSLKGCVSCHISKDDANKQYYPINAQNQFCSTCHQKVSVSVDCFACHRTTPQEDLL